MKGVNETLNLSLVLISRILSRQILHIKIFIKLISKLKYNKSVTKYK